jgi:hypothetical protein
LEAEVVAEDVQQWRARLDIHGMGTAVYFKRNFAHSSLLVQLASRYSRIMGLTGRRL